MNTRKTTLLKTIVEYLGRGAVPVDGIYWVGNSSERAGTGTTGTGRNATGPRGLNATANASSPRLDKCAPAARGT